MPKDLTLKKVEADIAAGDLGKARDRLQGLLRAYPADLEIRDRLGEVFWRLQYPEAAGRYWYLLPRDTEDRRGACAAFEARHGNDPQIVFRRLRLHPMQTADLPEHAREALEKLNPECLGALQGKRYLDYPATTRSLEFNGVPFLLALLVILALAAIGVRTVIGWLFLG